MARKRIFEDEEKAAAAEIRLCIFHNVGCVFDHTHKKAGGNKALYYEDVRKFKMKKLASFLRYQTDGQTSVNTATALGEVL